MALIRTLGIDPGSRFTGYGVVEGDGKTLCHVVDGIISLPGSLPLPERLGIIYQRIDALIHEVGPACLAIEDVFFAKNVKSALSLGQARGAAILAAVNAGLPVFEYSALQVKQAVAGYGKAGKDQMVKMIQYLFKLDKPLNPNAADALAVAICHLNTQSSRVRWSLSERS
jgi:crossover junction endodeoxyribonuclease RuvC